MIYRFSELNLKGTVSMCSPLSAAAASQFEGKVAYCVNVASA